MGKHSANVRGGSPDPRRSKVAKSRPGRIERLEPASTSAESVADVERRRQRPDFAERRRRSQRRRRLAVGCVTLIALLFLASCAAGLVYYLRVNGDLRRNFVTDAKANKALDPVPDTKDSPFYMIIMGVDSREKGEASRSDTLIVARIDPPRQRVTLLSIPRDTRVSIPGHGKTKINAAHAFGGPALVIDTVKDITGLPISHYAELDFSGFKGVVDALGGVTVDIPERIHDLKAANYVESAATLEPGRQRLDGAHALTFVRSRNFPLGDLQRIENQQFFIRALLAEALKPGNVLRLPSVIAAMAESVTTDMSVGDLVRIANQMKGMSADSLEAVTMPGEPKSVGGGSYVIMDEAAFAAMLERIKAGQPAETAEGEAAAAAVPANVSVTIKNGAGIAGVAGHASNILSAGGFQVGEVGNMNQFVYEETLVVYKDRKAAAELVVEALPVGKAVASRGMYAFNTDVLVVVGTDWGPPPPTHERQLRPD